MDINSIFPPLFLFKDLSIPCDTKVDAVVTPRRY